MHQSQTKPEYGFNAIEKNSFPDWAHGALLDEEQSVNIGAIRKIRFPLCSCSYDSSIYAPKPLEA
jgi:hypothetical protein